MLGLLFAQLSSKIELSQPTPPFSAPKPVGRFGLHRSQKVVFKLSALLSLDAFAGGFVLQSIVAYWFHVRFHVSPAVLGSIFFGGPTFWPGFRP